MVYALKACLSAQGTDTIRIATGYWDLPGFALIADELSAFLDREGTKLEILLGRDPLIYERQLAQHTELKEYPEDFIRHDLTTLEVTEAYVTASELLKKHCLPDGSGKIEVRVYRKADDPEKEVQFLHSKCYIFTGKVEKCAIMGSSNFTAKGLQGNSELNYLEVQPQVVYSFTPDGSNKSYVEWFLEKWEGSEEWTGTFIELIRKSKNGHSKPKPTPVPTPDEPFVLTQRNLYYRYLLHRIGDVVSSEAHEALKSYLPKNFRPITYQMDAVLQCFYIMKKHGGFLLADVVGLGKTVVAALIIRKFLDEAADLGRNPSVLVIAPPSVMPAWERTLQDFGTGKEVELLSSGKVYSIEDAPGETEELPDDSAIDNAKRRDYGLLIVDESHYFRNKESKRTQALDALIGEVELRTGRQPFVGLLSATPMNNKPDDLKQQILLFQRDGNRSTIRVDDGTRFLTFMNQKQKEFAAHNHSNEEEDKEAIRQIGEEIRDKVLKQIVVRRTRGDIKAGYPEDAKALKFPETPDPVTLRYQMDKELALLFSDTVNAIIGEESVKESLGFYRWAAIMYFNDPEITKRYETHNQTVEGISRRLQYIYQDMLVKRLESSFDAFIESFRRVKSSTENMIQMLENGSVYILPDEDLNAIVRKHGSLEAAIPELDKKVQKRNDDRNVVYPASAFKSKYLHLLQKDVEAVSALLDRWEKQKDDPKYDAFKEVVWTELFRDDINNPHKYDEKKLVIFTEALPTVDRLKEWFDLQYKNKGKKEYRALAVKADNRSDLNEKIRANFDANLPKEEWAYDYNVLITTEVLAEGVNLHRANVLLNYDTPWNATRLMQRMGRINRIGSPEDRIHVFNFHPSAEGNDLIKLLEIAHSKIQAFHNMLGEDSKILTDDEVVPESAGLGSQLDSEDSPIIKHIAALRAFEKEDPERYKVLADLPFRNLGGTTGSGDSVSLLSLTGDGSKFLNLRGVGASYEELDDETMMDELAILPDEPVGSPLTSPEAAEMAKELTTIFNDRTGSFGKGTEQSAQSRKAQTTLKNYLRPLLNDKPELEGLYKLLDGKVRAGNSYIIFKVNQIKEDFPDFNGAFDERQNDVAARFEADFPGLLGIQAEKKSKGPELGFLLRR